MITHIFPLPFTARKDRKKTRPPFANRLLLLGSALLLSHPTQAKIFDDDCAPEDRLETFYTRYKDFDGHTHLGSIKVLDTLSNDVKVIFETLYQQNYPIHLLKAQYTSDDIDGSGAFACRPITDGTRPSIHAYGAAIDLNPRENPYIHFVDIGDGSGNKRPDAVIPAYGWNYITRQQFREGKAEHKGINTQAVNHIFKQNGFLRWGGDWNSPIDYMHYEIYRDNAILFLTMNKVESQRYFEEYKHFYKQCAEIYPDAYQVKMQFTDLSKRITAEQGKLPVDIYEDNGFEALFEQAQAINYKIETGHSAQYCFLPHQLNQARHTALRQLQTLRQPSAQEMPPFVNASNLATNLAK